MKQTRHSQPKWLTASTLGVVALSTLMATLPISGAIVWLQQIGLYSLLHLIYRLEGGRNKLRKRPIFRVAISAITG